VKLVLEAIYQSQGFYFNFGQEI